MRDPTHCSGRLLRPADPVLPLTLRPVQAPVGRGDQLGHGAGIVRKRGDPEADADRQRAFQCVRGAGAALHLVSIGENSGLLAEYKAYCAKREISTAVTFLGHLPREEVLQWVKGCDIALNASYSEGYSNGIVEAMLLARPLIATAVGGNREQVVEGRTGLLVPAGDEAAMAEAMLALYHDRGRRLVMGKTGASRMRALHGENLAVQQHEDLYERMLSPQRSTHEG